MQKISFWALTLSALIEFWQSLSKQHQIPNIFQAQLIRGAAVKEFGSFMSHFAQKHQYFPVEVLCFQTATNKTNNIFNFV